MTYVEIPDGICFTQSGYTGEKDFDDIYLGINRTMEVLPIVKLIAIFDSSKDVENFYTWFEDQISNGVDTFLIPTMLFGKESTYGCRLTTKTIHSVQIANKVSMTVEVMFDSESTDNLPPSANALTLAVSENSVNNFIKLSGNDPEDDVLSYHVLSQPLFGDLTGTAPNLAYTPNIDYEGADSFTYNVKDSYNSSQTVTVTLNVGGAVIPDAEFEYRASGTVVISGNYYYDIGDGKITRGTGGELTPISENFKVWSNDHKITDNDNVTSIKVNNWGIRENYEDFLNGYPNIQSVTFEGAVGTCQGRIFTRMFKDFPKFTPLFNTSLGVYFSYMFEGLQASALPVYDFGEGLYFQGMIKGSSIDNTQVINSAKGQYFQEFAMNSAIKCIGGIDTGNAINTLKMWENTPLLENPSVISGDQADILQGINQPWTSPVTCAMSVQGVSETTYTVPGIATIDGTGTANGTYTVVYSGNASAPTFAWTCEGGTIKSGGDTATVEVEDTIGEDQQIFLSCVVTDSNGSVDTGKYEFTQSVNYLYPIIDIPKQYSMLNLREFIDANNPGSDTEIVLINSRVNCAMETGDLSGLNVVFKLSGELQGFHNGFADPEYDHNNGLTITSPLKLLNTGTISGCGGGGGTGGKGANDTHTVTTSETKYSFACGSGYSWADHDGTNLVTVAWGSNYKNSTTTGTGPLSGPVSGRFYRGKYRERNCCDVCGAFYEVRRETDSQELRVGGKGGSGGYGASYNKSDVYDGDWRKGEDGSGSSPSGGYSGGDGGNGGWWGSDGYTGDRGAGNGDYGTQGAKGGIGITGTNFLSGDSIIGTVYGGTTP